MFDLRAIPPQTPLFPASLTDRVAEGARPAQPDPLPATGAAGGPVIPTQAKPKSGLQAALADRENLKVLGQKLFEVATRLGVDATPQAVLAALGSTPMGIDPGSSYPLDAGSSITLTTFIRHLGFFQPTSHFHLASLADAVTQKALEHPLGDLGGGLSWPVPISPDEQRRLGALALDRLGDKGVLDYLNDQQPVDLQVRSNPIEALQSLISCAPGQRLGQYLQEQMDAVATDRSINDYLLAAIAVQMDPESITAPHRTKVAGFDLASARHWGKPASVVVDGLRTHLSASGRTRPEMAGVGAYLLLARMAPEFLIKDIPASVTYGSSAWVNLAVAARTIEAQSPGKVPNMTFVQVMLQAESAGLADPGVTWRAQKAALLDWGVANGLLERRDDEGYSDQELNILKDTFNSRQRQMISASQALDKAIPSRKELALAELKRRFGDLGALFEEKLISTTGHPRGGPGTPATYLLGRHSLLDIAMMDLPSPAVFDCADSRIPLAELNANHRFGTTEAFNQPFDDTIKNKKAAIGITIKHLVAQLPVVDRENLEYGKLTFYQNLSHTLGLGFTDRTQHPKGQELLLKVEREGKPPAAYEINFAQGVIRPVDLWRAAQRSSRNANVVYETKVFSPEGAPQQRNERTPRDNGLLDSFATPRTQYIADVFVEHLDLDDPQIKEHARGQTTLDEQKGTARAVKEFVLNLVPLRSAIVNFQQGNYGEGAVDLALDIFGFLTAGAAVAGKLGRLGGAAVSGVTKVLRGTKIIGVATIGAFNPLGGLGDLAVGGAQLAGKGLSKGIQAVNKLRGSSGSYDLLKAVSKESGVAATGTYIVAGRRIEGGAVLRNGKWYAFDVDRIRPYGSPLEGFVAQTKAVDGALAMARIAPGSELGNRLFAEYSVAPSRIAGLSRNSQGVYLAADGHLSHIRHIDSAGQTAVYEVRQVSRAEDGTVQARIYHNGRQTPLLVEHVQGDQWRRLTLRGAGPVSVADDLGPEIAAGGEGVIYASRDGKSVYKDLGPTSLQPSANYLNMEVISLNKYYGDGFARGIIEDGFKYIKMRKLDGVALSHFERGSLPPQARSLLDDALAQMEAKDIYHNDLQLKNFMYSAKDQKIYPVDMDSQPLEFMVPVVMAAYVRQREALRQAFARLLA
ncbi:hypothetical protein HBO12_22440 [Pseudomonas sp. WS 5059]|uniref:OspG family effector kinase n=1 Tax=Pseudomonas sp. WS 5059 TaxID=2717491 RepID=UPI001472D39A|nr:hypothetical protein [Pseudomonas sp. WS 5059]NMY05725.1 hypothetical protein [Pseudomonas sp. WS 5059]